MNEPLWQLEYRCARFEALEAIGGLGLTVLVCHYMPAICLYSLRHELHHREPQCESVFGGGIASN
jgi:hypothetical protein